VDLTAYTSLDRQRGRHRPEQRAGNRRLPQDPSPRFLAGRANQRHIVRQIASMCGDVSAACRQTRSVVQPPGKMGKRRTVMLVTDKSNRNVLCLPDAHSLCCSAGRLSPLALFAACPRRSREF
jgi:hypothetical protein